MGKITQKLGLKGTRHFHAHEIARFDALSGLPLASFRQRAWAISIDVMIAGTLKVLLHLSEVHDHSDGPVTVASLLMEAVHWLKEVVESVLYFGVLLKLGRGQTPGKFFMKVRVMSLTQETISWWQSIERALGYGASLLEGGFGFFQFFMSRNRQCVHDRIAETIVVDERPTAKRLVNENCEPEDMVLP